MRAFLRDASGGAGSGEILSRGGDGAGTCRAESQSLKRLQSEYCERLSIMPASLLIGRNIRIGAQETTSPKFRSK